MDQHRRQDITNIHYENMNRNEFGAWFKVVSSKLLWFSYSRLIDIAAKYTSLYGQEKEYPQPLIEALDIASKIEMAKEKKKSREEFQSFPASPNLREKDCWQEYNSIWHFEAKERC